MSTTKPRRRRRSRVASRGGRRCSSRPAPAPRSPPRRCLARAGTRRDLFDLRGAEPTADASASTGPRRRSSPARSGAPTRACASRARSTTRSCTKIIVHHTGTPNDITDYAGLARGIFTNELNNGYIDIAYNWLIDPQRPHLRGSVGAELSARRACTPASATARTCMGAHALHFNPNTIGIGLMGDYSSVAPSAAMIAALITLMTWKCARWGIDPLGAVPYVNSQGARSSGLANICGHRDTYATACPGSTVEAMLPNLRVQVASRVAIGATGYWIASSARSARSRSATCPTTAARRGVGLSAPIIGIGGASVGPRATGCSARTAACSRSATRRFHGSTGAHAPQPADRRDGADDERQRLLARRPRRRRVLLRRREVPRLDRARCG